MNLARLPGAGATDGDREQSDDRERAYAEPANHERHPPCDLRTRFNESTGSKPRRGRARYDYFRLGTFVPVREYVDLRRTGTAGPPLAIRRSRVERWGHAEQAHARSHPRIRARPPRRLRGSP